MAQSGSGSYSRIQLSCTFMRQSDQMSEDLTFEPFELFLSPLLHRAQLSNYLTLEVSFSSVSTAAIARKEAFCSIFRALQDLHSFAPLESQVEKNLETTTQKIPTKTEENAAPKCRTEIPEPPKHTLQDERCTVTAHCRSELLEEVRWGCMRNRLHTTNKRL